MINDRVIEIIFATNIFSKKYDYEIENTHLLGSSGKYAQEEICH